MQVLEMKYKSESWFTKTTSIFVSDNNIEPRHVISNNVAF